MVRSLLTRVDVLKLRETGEDLQYLENQNED